MKKSTQVIYLCAGLANRMFQYALYLHYKRNGYNALIADNSIVTIYKHEDVRIREIFANVVYNTASKSQVFIMGGSNDVISRFLRNRLHIYSPFYVRTGAEDGFVQSVLSPKKSSYHSGVFQSEKYFKDVCEEVRRAFVFHPFDNGKNLMLQNKMAQENSVAIHIRKGNDYQNGEPYINTCTIEYYSKAIEYIKERVQNPVFYVFTDNPKWVEKNLAGIVDYTLVDWNPAVGKGNHYDMQLMSCAKHNIIANSTYSWWGAWLNSNPYKIVVGPKQWFNPLCAKFNKVKDLKIIPDSWIKI